MDTHRQTLRRQYTITDTSAVRVYHYFVSQDTYTPISSFSTSHGLPTTTFTKNETNTGESGLPTLPTTGVKEESQRSGTSN